MIPKYSDLMLPILELSASGDIDVHDAISAMAKRFSLSDEEIRERVSEKTAETKISHRVYWARTYLKKAGLVEDPKRRHFRATKAGLDVLAQKPPMIDRKFLMQFPAFVAFVSPKKTDQGSEEPSLVDDADIAPQDAITSASEQLSAALRGDLLDKLRDGSPEFFERSIVDLFLAMGFGASKSSGMRIGGAGDNGVDGVIDQDALGVDQVYIQAKRYKEANKIGAGPIREFFGALSLKDVSKGIFVTTSSYTSAATETAEKLGARIILIDGEKLANLMIDHHIGCRVETTVEIMKLDEGYFE